MKRDGILEAGDGLDGKVVVVTGGTGYLGSSVCKAFAETGATVVSVYLLDREIPYFEKTLGALGKNVTLLKADVTQPGEMERVTKEILPRLKRIDVLVNTVGGYMAGPVEETSAEDFDRAMALNLKSAFLACKAVVPSMRAAKRGSIVSVSSEAALEGEEESFLYSASKSGVNRLTESLARELKAANVRVNCVMPRIMDTPSNREAMPKANFEMGDDGPSRSRDSLALLGRRGPDHRCGDSGLWRSLTFLLGPARHAFGISFPGSRNGFLTMVAVRGPSGCSTISSVPMSACTTGNIAYPMFAFNRGE